MRTANLRAFIPTTGATVFNSKGQRFRLDGRDPIYDERGCGSKLTVTLPGERTTLGSAALYLRDEILTFSVTSVAAGDTVVLRRPGRPDVKETFKHDGIVLDAPIPAIRQNLHRLRGRPIELDVDFEPRQFGESGVSVASVAAVRLAGKGERGDCQLRLID